MANLDHVKMLKQGVAAWNAWREKNPDIRPDLRGADLGGANRSIPASCGPAQFYLAMEPFQKSISRDHGGDAI
jgi:hypothetical protein